MQGMTAPKGMKLWPGGDEAPADFDYGEVQFADGLIGSVSKCSDLWSRTPVSGDPHVTAYTPAVANEGEREALARKLLREAVANRDASGASIAKHDRGEVYVGAAVDAIMRALSTCPTLDNTAVEGQDKPLNRTDLYRFMDTLKLSEKREVATEIGFDASYVAGESDFDRWKRMWTWAANNDKKAVLAKAIRAYLAVQTEKA